MFHTASAHYERMGPQARAITDTVELFYRAEIAEGLLRGKPGPRSFDDEAAAQAAKEAGKKPFDISEMALRQLSGLPKRVRHKLARRLMRENLRTKAPLAAHDQELLKRLVDPTSKTPMSKRFDLWAELTEVITPQKSKIKDPLMLVGHLRDIIGQFVPGQMPFNNGRPHEPTPPPPTDEPAPTPPPPATAEPSEWAAGALSRVEAMHFEIERLTCLDATRGEAGEDEIAYAVLMASGEAAAFETENSGGGVINGVPALPYDSPRYWRVFTEVHDAGSFDDGDTRLYAPRDILCTFDIEGMTVPRYLVVFFAMAEIDPQGGFGQYIRELQGELTAGPATLGVSGYIALYMSTLAILGVSVTVGAALGGPIGALVGLVVGAAISFVNYLVAGFLNRDDVFDLQVRVLELTEDTLSGWPFFGTDLSVPLTFQTHGDHGLYEITHRWRMDQAPVFQFLDSDLQLIDV
ncbi:hypothetical protein shim_30930 [Shimia sp. SK013]|uniref:hypothetical protein n=1 Tax=Shimia sp. SK013 TaxID=1389006 RepID=UPI0006B54DD2|nr:hypothetical protein [Shimia sp. SK013]KPA20640.1 hypothetical protein shim_30930 [Shimia sp. SK013]